MADNLKTVLPVLRERSVYVKDDGYGKDNSNYINKSFKGILRLSPNDSASYQERESYISYNDTTADYISFEDDISEQLKKQFIKVSTSDGILLDLRIAKEGVEYDNLYILGAVKTEAPLQLFVKDDKGFKLGATDIICKTNNIFSATERNNKQYAPINDETLDDTHVLINANGRGLEFVSAKNIINLFVKEALLKLSAVPSGSIHFVPINIKQYDALLKKSKGHNISALDNDPLIRDYLLCDGSYYRSTDFPELAKVLNKEKIVYWKNVFKDDINDNSRKVTHLVKAEDTNNRNIIDVYSGVFKDDAIEKEEPTPTLVFRVPDLRGMFVQSALMGYAQPNTVGDYSIDSITDSKLMIKYGGDNHYHYIVLDNPMPNRNTFAGTLSEVLDESTGYDGVYQGTPTALARFGGIYAVKKTRITNSCGKCCKSCDGAYGGSGIYKPNFKSQNCTIVGPSGGYILSTLNKKMSATLQGIKWLGTASWAIDMSIPDNDICNDKEIDKHLNYTMLKDDAVYNNHAKSYVSYDSENMRKLLGYENTPEFYGVLPLIKI